MSRSIWMLISTFYPVVGGTQSQVLNLSRHFLAEGWDVRVITRQHSIFHPDGLPKYEVVDGIPVQRIYSRGGKIGSVFFLLGGLLHLFRYGRGQIYHAHDTGAAGWMAVAARSLWGGRAIIKLRTGHISYSNINTGKVAQWLFGLLLRSADIVHVVSKEGTQIALEMKVRPERIIDIPNSVDTAFFTPAAPGEKTRLRQELGLPVDKIIVLYVGRFEYVKGVDVLLNAWARLTCNIRDQMLLVLLGDGSEREMLCEIIDKKQINVSVCMLGFKKNVRDYYRAANILALPSRDEGLSNSMVEAMACGIPVIASNVGGARDFINDRKNGFIFESENIKQLALIISGIFFQKDVGLSARNIIEERASLDKSAKYLLTIYQKYFDLKAQAAECFLKTVTK